MDVQDLTRLEKKYNFNYPQLYIDLCKAGMLDTGKYGPEWLEKIFPIKRHNPTLLLFGMDFELIEEDKLEEYIEDIKDPEYPGIKAELNFIPFAISNGGDWYCFYFDNKSKTDIPIAFVPHDEGEFTIVAKNLQDFIFREMLNSVTDVSWGNITEPNLEENLTNYLRTHSKFITSEQKKILEEIYQRELKTFQDKHFSDVVYDGLLSIEEFNEILNKTIAFEDFDKDFDLYDDL